MISPAFYFLLPVIDAVVQTAGVNAVPALHRVDCVKANELCTGDLACSSKYRTLRQCLAGSASMVTGPEAKNECISAMEVVQQSPLYNCRCKRGMKNEKRCLRIYWSIHQSFMHGFTITGHDLVGSPYEPLNNRLSDIFRAASIISGKMAAYLKALTSHLGAEPLGSKGNNCLDAAKACNLNDNCKKFRSMYISLCAAHVSASEICNRRKCHRALRQFFDRVPAKYTYGMLFCSCRDMACIERRRQTIVPICSYQDKEKPNCLSLADMCKTNYICRSRLADFITNCQPEPRSTSGCLRQNYAACLLAYSGLIGTVITPNYIDSTGISVAPWCTCIGSGNQKEECDEFHNFFKDNRCFKNAIQAFGNGTDVNVWQLIPPVPTTASSKHIYTPQDNPESVSNEIHSVDDDNVFPLCANLQAQRLHSNVSVNPDLCIRETQISTSNDKEIAAVQSKEQTSPKSSSANSPEIHISAMLWMIAIAYSTFPCFYSTETL
ncbi:GDNF family receptor alpha-1-like isoform X2 [Scyliorhinus canicula]|uniref:GDNF family receptor alpha n=1 Tax=Scyliorhinus canicula TaxID=7830 RepID=U5NFK4_SCYCA|nr:GDNF family receptor alpha-1-like isoform X2 [Scyliorhinus canicula]AGY14507.1 glial cell line derived neurotrophic factor family receptor alpha 1 [Scyliorhinus canicula]